MHSAAALRKLRGGRHAHARAHGRARRGVRAAHRRPRSCHARWCANREPRRMELQRQVEGTSSMLCWRARVRSSCLARALPCLSRWICVCCVRGGVSAGKENGLGAGDLADTCREPSIVRAHKVCCVDAGVLAFEVREGEVEVHLPPKVTYTQWIRMDLGTYPHRIPAAYHRRWIRNDQGQPWILLIELIKSPSAECKRHGYIPMEVVM
jgi:hypothetical protein